MPFGLLIYKIINLLCVIWWIHAKLRGVKISRTARLTSKIQIRKYRSASIILGDEVTIHSKSYFNPLIKGSSSTFWAMSPYSTIELKDHVGCSSVCICASKRVTIGEGTIIGADCLLIDNDFHQPGPGWTWNNDFEITAKPIEIGRGCFIGARSIVLKGVTIGDGCVIAAGSTVSRDVPPYHLAYGNPVKIKPLTDRWLRHDVIQSSK